ncbi:Retrovirus-related Pol polyprotein from type-2 retrotransposable element R2DM [Dictyocoela muelleri]|nr:Retrovirus-related Pol polyprotein from type-2 retrotransposable element R2DM [Dictyocoela muelleri]
MYSILIKKSPQSWYKLLIGLPQGSIISPILFNVFIDDLIEFIPLNLKKNVLLYADDILIFTRTLSETQMLFNRIIVHSVVNEYNLNPLKSFVLSNYKCLLNINSIPIEQKSLLNTSVILLI